MNNRVTSDSGNTVSLFPFLAVLLCTMGALLVLLVVLAQRAGERAVAERSAEKSVLQVEVQEEIETPEEPPQEPALDQTEREKLKEQLEETLAAAKALKAKREQAEQRLRDEQDKLTHLEEHTRRLEHEVAQLSVAAEQLEATENDQVVNQQQAEQELQRLKDLIDDKQQQIDQLQEELKGKKTYAIVPFLGKDGVETPRIYLECCAEGVKTQPEGLLFDEDDFRAPGWAGNPLAQVVRATQQHIHAKAQDAGVSQSYALPLIIVRPAGIEALQNAQIALESAEIPYGFDYVGGVQDLSYPVAVDPQLAEKQYHARMNARRHMVVQINSAPRKYKPMLESLAVTAGEIGVGTTSTKAALFRRLATDGYSGSGEGGTSGSNAGGEQSSLASGDGYGAVEGDAQFGAFGDGRETSTAAGDRYDSGGTQALSSTGGTEEGSSGQFGGSESRYSGQVGSSQGSAMASTSQGTSSSNTVGSAGGSNSMGGKATSSFGSAGGTQQTSRQGNAENDDAEQIAARRRNSVPIQRPIQVVVRKDHVALLPSRHVTNASASSGATIPLDQSSQLIAEELGVAIRQHMQEWGIAGQGLYWKPVITLKVGPDGGDAAQRLEKILSGSGLRVISSDNTRVSRGGANNGPR